MDKNSNKNLKEEFNELDEKDSLDVYGGKSVVDVITNGFDLVVKSITDLIK